MALPKDPTTKTSAAAPPPKKPPVVVADEIFTPKPPPDLPPNVRVSSPAQTIANLRIPDVSDEALIAAFKDKPLYVLDRVSWPKLKSPDRKRLENLINQDPALKKILNYVLPVYPPAAPQTQPQPAPTATAQEIPISTAEQLSQQEPAVTPKEKELEDLTPPERQKLEKWMNGIKPGFYEYLAEKKFDAATSQHMFTNSFLEYLAMYKGGLAGFYLSQGAHELMYSALGPIGEALSGLHQKDLRWKIAWMKNPLNPNALYYYLNVLPEESAFKLLFLPVKASWGILARGGAPLISKTTYRETNQRRRDYGQVKTGYFFSPTLRLAQGVNILADGLDKLTGIPTDDNFFNQYLQKKNHDFTNALNELKKAKTMGQSSRIFGANQKIKNLLRQYDGNFFKQWFKPGFSHLSRRLRQHHSDPISYLLALVGGTIFDIFVGIGANLVKVAANRALGLIPGYNALRVRLTEFFTSNRWLQTARIGGATGQAFLKGTFSMTTASTTYAGASIGGWLANALGLPTYPFQIIGGGIGATFGSIYTTSLKMLDPRLGYFNPQGAGWVQRYDKFLAEGNMQAIKDGYLKGFKPGPFSNFARWLYNHPFARLPINGFVIADLGVKFLGWNPLVAYPSLIAGDYLWQIKGNLARFIGEKFMQTNFYTRFFDPLNPYSIPSKLYNRFIYRNWLTRIAGSFPQGQVFVDRPWFRVAKNFWSKAQPYLRNLFNPGFFMGMQFLGSVFMSMGLPWGIAHLVGGLAGGAVWWGIHGIYSAIAGKGAMSLAQWSAAGWVGYFGGLIAQGLLSLIGVHGAWMQFLPMAGSLIATVGVALIPGLGGFLGSFFAGLSTYNIAWALGISSTAYAAGMAIAATVASIALVAGLTIFSGFVIFSAFWVPFQAELTAGPQSSNFSINTNCTQTATNQYNCCSNFSLTENVFNSQNYLDHNTDFIKSGLTVNLTDPATTTKAFRGISLIYTTYVPDWVNGTNYSLVIPPGNMIDDAHPYLDSFLPTPTDQQQNLFELMQQSRSVVYSMRPFFDILTSLAKEHGQAQHLIAEYEASLTLMKEQQILVDDLIDKIEDGDLDGALTKANEYLPPPASRNPLGDPCPDTTQPCPEEKQGLKKLYDSWEPMVKRYINTITNYQSQTAPNLDNFLAQLEQEQKGLKQQINLLPQIIDQMEKIQKDITEKDAAEILDTDFLNFTKMTLAEQTDVWNNLLAKYFPKVFDKSKTFFFIPQGTNYRLCIDADYSGPPDVPQTVCSTIMYKPSIWGPNTAFAKHCTTFTPQ